MRTILMDLDGVLNQYTGYYMPDFIPPIKFGAKEFVAKLSQDYKIILFTARPQKLAENWLVENKLNGYIKEVTNKKVPAYLHIDDRCIKFDGDYSNLYDEIQNFHVWYR